MYYESCAVDSSLRNNILYTGYIVTDENGNTQSYCATRFAHFPLSAVEVEAIGLSIVLRRFGKSCKKYLTDSLDLINIIRNNGSGKLICVDVYFKHIYKFHDLINLKKRVKWRSREDNLLRKADSFAKFGVRRAKDEIQSDGVFIKITKLKSPLSRYNDHKYRISAYDNGELVFNVSAFTRNLHLEFFHVVKTFYRVDNFIFKGVNRELQESLLGFINV